MRTACLHCNNKPSLKNENGRHTAVLRIICRGRHVASSPGPVDVDILALGMLVGCTFGLDPERVRAEVVALCLQEVGGEGLGADAVVEAERRAEGRGWDPPQGALGDNVSPARLRLGERVVEKSIEEEVLEVRVLPVRGGDVFEEDGADDAAASPHQGNVGLVELPAIFLGSLFLG